MWVGLIVMVGMCLYPPWTSGKRRGGWGPDGYALIFRRVSENDIRYRTVQIDVTRLLVQEAAAVLLFGGLLVTLKDKKGD